MRAPPITFTVPALVAGLMIVVSMVISEQVLSRLIETQERQLRDLSGAYLDGMSASLIHHVLREDVWEVFDALDRSKRSYEALRPIETIVVGTDSMVIAASSPDAIPSLEPVPGALLDRLGSEAFAIDEEEGRIYLSRELSYQETPVGAIYAIADIRHVLDERSEVTATLIVTNVLLTLLLAGVGYLTVRRMVQPVRVLADHLSNSATGRPEPIAASLMPGRGTEARRLFDSYNVLVEAEREREVLSMKLAEEERLASLGRLASGMAHEINNPLGGLFNALDTLKRHGETAAVRVTSVSLLERGLKGIRDVVAAALHTYRPDRRPHPFGPSDLDDLRLLIMPEVRRRSLQLEWSNRLTSSLDVPNAPLRQAILNLLLNACNASPNGGSVSLSAMTEGEAVTVEICDDGAGLPDDAAKLLEGPAGPAPITGGGLGLWMVHRSMIELGGAVSVARRPEGGTIVKISVPASPHGMPENEREASNGTV